jgi:hypothetical protein
MVEEQVASSGLNKPETAIRNQPLYLTLWHCCLPRKTRCDAASDSQKRKCSQTNNEQIAQAKKGREAQLRGRDGKNDRFGRPDQHRLCSASQLIAIK